ncbi:hypothetical protein GDO81_015643 [Engystomops pustulosus]|uniref:Uncharacterized protein n=1 Tax=Engystomops pustulosus TaxID=76066 RepID=A0AAV7ANJ0_ENGPU|nr:hypothetical protein GDO81_015643 [Engystomops pustulosus]
MALAQHHCSWASDKSSPVYPLAGVKHCLFHPRLPTLRRMEMDSMVHKLSDEHSRTNTPCDHRSFKNTRFTTYGSEKHLLPSLEITNTGRQLTRRDTHQNTEIQRGWTKDEDVTCRQAAKDSPRGPTNSGDFQLMELKKMDLGFGGYAVRFLSPEVTHSWKFCLQHNPSLDEYGQKPVPVEIMNIFRTFGPAYR